MYPELSFLSCVLFVQCVEVYLFNNIIIYNITNFFTSTGLIFSLPTYKLFTFVFNSFKPVGTLTGFLMSNLLRQLLNQQNLV